MDHSTPPSICLHTLLRPEIVEWDVRSKHCIPDHRRQRYERAATTPPLRTMIFMVPGFMHHLPPLEIMNGSSSCFISVAQVFRYLYHHLRWNRLPEDELNLSGDQLRVAQRACRNRFKHKGYNGPFNDNFYDVNMRGIDLLRGHTQFGGILHQLDANGANVFIVALHQHRTIRSLNVLPPILSPGYIPWDFKDAPLAAMARMYGPSAAELLEQEITLKERVMSISDVIGDYAVDIPLSQGSPAEGDRVITDVKQILNNIQTTLTVPLSSNDWPLWNSSAAMTAKSIPPFDDTSSKRLTYLDATPPRSYRFLGIWEDINTKGLKKYTLLTQPSTRDIPLLHLFLLEGNISWDIKTDPTDQEGVIPFDEPATFPARRSMSLSIEIMPGQSWRIELSNLTQIPFVTVGQVLIMIHKFLAIDDFNIPFCKLPPNLMYEIRSRAQTRSNWDPVDGYKRVDTLRGALCTGLAHCVSPSGEDEWKVCLQRPKVIR